MSEVDSGERHGLRVPPAPDDREPITRREYEVMRAENARLQAELDRLRARLRAWAACGGS